MPVECSLAQEATTGPKASGPTPQVTAASMERDSEGEGLDSRQGQPVLWTRLAAAVRESQGIKCGCSAPVWLDRVEDPDASKVTITHRCGQCGLSQISKLSRKRLQEIGKAACAAGSESDHTALARARR